MDRLSSSVRDGGTDQVRRKRARAAAAGKPAGEMDVTEVRLGLLVRPEPGYS